MFDPHVCTYQVVSDIPPTAIRDIPVQYLLLHTHIVLRLWNIFQYMLFIKKLPV